jgi:hypothetical protein
MACVAPHWALCYAAAGWLWPDFMVNVHGFMVNIHAPGESVSKRLKLPPPASLARRLTCPPDKPIAQHCIKKMKTRPAAAAYKKLDKQHPKAPWVLEVK